MPTLRSQSVASAAKNDPPPDCPPAPPSVGPATPVQEHESLRSSQTRPLETPKELPSTCRSRRLNTDNVSQVREKAAVTFQDKGKGKVKEDDFRVPSSDEEMGTSSLVLERTRGGRGEGRGRSRGGRRGRGRIGHGGRMAEENEEDSKRIPSSRRKRSDKEADLEAKRARKETQISSSASSSSDSSSSSSDSETQMELESTEAGPSTPQLEAQEISRKSANRGRNRGGGRGRQGRDAYERSRTRFLEIARRRAAHFAHFDADGDRAPAGELPAPQHQQQQQRRRRRRLDNINNRNDAQAQGQQQPPPAAHEDWPGPFSTARRLVEGRAAAAAARQHASSSTDAKVPLVDWHPSRPAGDAPFHKRIRSSLQDMCLSILAAHADNIESLEGVPDFLKSRISAAFCGRRKMNSKTASLLFQGEPSEVRIPDCTLISETELTQILAQFSPCRVEELHLGLCGRAMSEQCVLATLASSPERLPMLNSLSVSGAYRLTDKGLEALLRAAPLVTCLDLSNCSFLSEAGIRAVADCSGSTLKTLVLDGCKQLDGAKILSALVRMPQLQKLSLSAVGGINDEVVSELAVQLGPHLQELSLAQCSSITDAAMAAIGACCGSLKVLNLDHLSLLTDISIARIADGCNTLGTLTMTRCKFSDEAVAAYVTASGGSLSELSVNAVPQVADQTLLALAKHTQGCLKWLDASWCRQMTDDGLGFLADSCSKLCELRLFGCTQVTERFLKGHNNPNLNVVGR